MEKVIKTHKDLIVWQKSIDFVVEVYEKTKAFPQSELFALTNQVRRCVTSIPANIAEGSGRKGNREFVQFLHISLGSAVELETFLIIALRLGYLNEENFKQLDTILSEITKMLTSLIKSLKTKQQN